MLIQTVLGLRYETTPEQLRRGLDNADAAEAAANIHREAESARVASAAPDAAR
jgi:hypothetical protein